MVAQRELMTFEKTIGPGVSVRITGVPASIHGTREIRAFDRRTAYRIESLLGIARSRMANGETDITLDFTTGA